MRIYSVTTPYGKVAEGLSMEAVVSEACDLEAVRCIASLEPGETYRDADGFTFACGVHPCYSDMVRDAARFNAIREHGLTIVKFHSDGSFESFYLEELDRLLAADNQPQET